MAQGCRFSPTEILIEFQFQNYSLNGRGLLEYVGG